MSQMSIKQRRILAIDPATRGFGFAVFENENLIDWGVKEARDNKNSRCLKQISRLIDHYQPDVIVVEDYRGKGSRRCHRIQELLKGIQELASERKIRLCSFSKQDIRKAFSAFGPTTKQSMAESIVKMFPELSPKLPPARKPWMSEDYRMGIFDAVALVVTYFCFIKN